MLKKPDSCIGCPLHALGKGFMAPEGTGSSGVMLLGEALGFHEAQEGLPFRPQAQAGSMLTRLLRLTAVNRPEVTIANVIWCQPPNDFLRGASYEMEAINHCAPNWQNLVKTRKPRVIVALGDTACRTLTGLCGKKKTITNLRGYPMDTQWGVVLPTYHPSFIQRGKHNLIGVCLLDLKKAFQIANWGFRQHAVDYETHPSLEKAQEFYEQVKSDPEALLAFDIETEYSLEEDDEILHEEDEEKDEIREAEEFRKRAESKLLSIQFSLFPYTAIYLPWFGAFAECARNILLLRNPKVGHNAYRFDLPKLREAGVEVHGTVMDTMWMFHHLQPDLSGHYNLQSVGSFYGHDFPWKHLSHDQPEFYGCVDADVLQRIMARLPDEMKKRQVWDGYQRHIVQLEPVLQAMSRRGMPVNEEARKKLGEELTLEKEIIFQKMQAHVPEELKNVSPKEGYVREPKDLAGLVLRHFDVTIEELVELPERCKCKRGCRECGGTTVKKRSHKTGKKVKTGVERWCNLEPFKPSSSQILKYIRFMGHPIQMHHKEDRPTTDTIALKRLSKITKDPLYADTLEYRQVEKILSTYVEGWIPGPDGRIHPQFLYKPATGQLSSISPNVQNASAGKCEDQKKKELAKRFRTVIQAPPGFKLVELDYHSFHGMTMGYMARDKDYMRLAKLDMHSFLTSYIVKEPIQFSLPIEEICSRLAYIKKKYPAIRQKAKVVGLGTQFGMGANSLFKQNEEFFSSKSEAQAIITMLDRLFPKVAKYKQEVVKLAHKQKYLLSPFGYIRWFWQALKYDPLRKCLVHGEQAEQAMAFLPANIAFGHKKEAMLTLAALGLDEKYGLVNEVHDSLLFCCPEGLVSECCQTVQEIMEAPSKILIDPEVAPNGLSVNVDVMVGDNWAGMKEE